MNYEVCFKIKAHRDRSLKITPEMVQIAKENLVLRRDTHLDQLVDKLTEERVKQVIEPILAGVAEYDQIPASAISYVRDLGLITTNGQLRIANPIYQEIIPRELNYSIQVTLTQETFWYVQDNGKLDMIKLLTEFQAFFREHSEHWVQRFDYLEAGPQLLLQAFLQRIVNGGGRIEREYGLGRMRTDLLILWNYPAGAQKVVIELKILYKSRKNTIAEGLEQTWGYMDTSGAEEGHLIIFDRSSKKPWSKKIFRTTKTYQNQRIEVWGM